MSIYVKYFLRYWALVFLQTVLLNKVTLRWWAAPEGFPVFLPQIYPLFILFLPLETPLWFLLILGFALGLTVDMFSNTQGMHAAATVILAYARNMILLTLLPKNLSEYKNQIPSIYNLGWIPLLTYCLLLLLLHHIVFFTVEMWGFTNFQYLLIKILASIVTTMLLVVVYILLFERKNRVLNFQ